MSRSLKLMLIGLLASLAVFWVVLQMPRFGTLLLLLPAIYIYLGFSLPTKLGYVIGSTFFAIVSILVNHPLAMMIGLFGGLIPVAMTLVARRDYLEDAVLKTVVIVYGGLLASQYYLLQVYRIDLYQVYLEGLRVMITQWNASGVSTTGIFNSLSDSYLSMVFILATAFSLGLFGLASFLRHLKLIDWQNQPFYFFKFKGLNFLQFGAIMLAIYLLSSAEAPYRIVGQNGMQFIMVLFAIQGLSVAYFYLKKRQINRVVSVFLLGLTLVLPMMNTFISLLGFSDSLFDFRKLEAMK